MNDKSRNGRLHLTTYIEVSDDYYNHFQEWVIDVHISPEGEPHFGRLYPCEDRSCQRHNTEDLGFATHRNDMGHDAQWEETDSLSPEIARRLKGEE